MEPDDTPEAENLNLAYSVRLAYDFGALESWNGLFSDFQKSTDLGKENNEIQPWLLK